jgi:hypothetical protein
MQGSNAVSIARVFWEWWLTAQFRMGTAIFGGFGAFPRMAPTGSESLEILRFLYEPFQ